jgi:hypothetical protein
MTPIYDAAGARTGRPFRQTIAAVIVALYAAAAMIAGALGLLAATSASLQFQIPL